MSSMKDIVLRNAEQLGMAIRSLRQQKNVSQQQLAAELGV